MSHSGLGGFVGLEHYPGYLATITTQAENDFVQGIVDNTMQTNVLDQLFMGGYYAIGQWHWVTTETWAYTNWNTGEPNNDPAINESRVAMWGPAIIPPPGGGQGPHGYRNNTVPATYTFWSIVEWGNPHNSPRHPPPGVPEPSTVLLFGGAGIVMVVRYVGLRR